MIPDNLGKPLSLCGIVFSEIASPTLGKSLSPGDEEEVSPDPSQFLTRAGRTLQTLWQNHHKQEATLAELAP